MEVNAVSHRKPRTKDKKPRKGLKKLLLLSLLLALTGGSVSHGTQHTPAATA